jgi:hypothetical protein
LSEAADTIDGMSPVPPDQALVRPSDVVDTEIRALLQETGGWLWGPTRERYEELRDEWVQAVRAEVTTAA